MNAHQAKLLINLLKDKGVKFEHGLTDNEIDQIEQKFHIQFPPDLRLFLQTQLPVSNKFVNWRLALKSPDESNHIKARLAWVLDGMLFDVKNKNFWWHEWGEKPDNLSEHFDIAKRHFKKYPKMIPIYSHRYIPSSPNQSGNPVFSIYQTDIIYYGNDLASYLAHEFGFKLPKALNTPDEPKRIVFWSDLTDYMNMSIDEE